MLVSRRSFIATLLIAPIAASNRSFVDPYKHPWIYRPTELQKKFFEESIRPMLLHGIPYHQSNITSGQWLGFRRD